MRARLATTGSLLLVIAASACGTQPAVRQVPGQEPSPGPSDHASTAEHLAPKASPAHAGPEWPPVVTVKHGDTELRLKAPSWCSSSSCAFGPDQNPDNDLGVVDGSITIRTSLIGWMFEAYQARAKDMGQAMRPWRCRRCGTDRPAHLPADAGR